MKRILAIFTSMRDAYFATGATDYDFNNWATVVKDINPMFKNFLLNIDFNTDGSLVQFRYNGYCIYHRNLEPKNSIYRECRSHVVDLAAMRFIVTPFKKFFNYNEIPAENITEEECVVKYEKLDGSLIIMTWKNNQPFVVTSKSLVARAGNRVNKVIELLAKEENSEWVRMLKELPDCTIMAELIGYNNTHVVQYDIPLELRLIGVRATCSGRMATFHEMELIKELFKVKSARIELATIEELLQNRLTDKSNIEGWVIVAKDGRMMKIKTAHYCSMHKVLLGRGHANQIIEFLAKDKIDDLIGSLTPEAIIVIMPVIQKAMEYGKNIQDISMNIADTLRPLDKRTQHNTINMFHHTIQPYIRQALYKGKVEYVYSQSNGRILTFAEIEERAKRLLLTII